MSKKNTNYERFTDEEIMKSLFLTQLLLVSLSMILLFLFYRDLSVFKEAFLFNIKDVLLIGVTSGLGIVSLQLLMNKYLPEDWLEDDGLNERIFRNRTILQVFFISLGVALVEEWVFRGVIQTKFGIIFTSILFALIHVRYLKKMILLILLVGISFLFGYLYQITGSLWVPMVAHFIVDFLLGIYILKNVESEEGGMDADGEEIRGPSSPSEGEDGVL